MFVSGTVVRTEGQFVAYLRLFESATGRQLASAHLEGDSVRALRQQFEPKAEEFFGKAIEDVAKAPAVAPGARSPRSKGTIRTARQRFARAAEWDDYARQKGAIVASREKLAGKLQSLLELPTVGLELKRKMLADFSVAFGLPATAAMVRNVQPVEQRATLCEPYAKALADVNVSVLDANGYVIGTTIFADGKAIGESAGTIRLPLCTSVLSARTTLSGEGATNLVIDTDQAAQVDIQLDGASRLFSALSWRLVATPPSHNVAPLNESDSTPASGDVTLGFGTAMQASLRLGWWGLQFMGTAGLGIANAAGEIQTYTRESGQPPVAGRKLKVDSDFVTMHGSFGLAPTWRIIDTREGHVNVTALLGVAGQTYFDREDNEAGSAYVSHDGLQLGLMGNDERGSWVFDAALRWFPTINDPYAYENGMTLRVAPVSFALGAGYRFWP